jgi:hypothetical protein
MEPPIHDVHCAMSEQNPPAWTTRASLFKRKLMQGPSAFRDARKDRPEK